MKFLGATVYIFLLFGEVLICYLKPYHNWDMLGYMGCAMSLEYSSPDSIHEKTFRVAEAEIDTKEYNRLINTGAIESKSFLSPDFFYSRLRFYWVKPAYVLFIFFLNKLGFSLIFSTLIPSLLSLAWIGLLVLYWSRKHLGDIAGSIISSGIILLPPFWEVGRLSTPDALAGAFVLTGFYFLIEKRNSTIALFLLTFSVLIRIDLMLLACITMVYFLFFKTHEVQINRKIAIISLITVVLLTALILMIVSNGRFDFNLIFRYGGIGAPYFRKVSETLFQYGHLYFIFFLCIIFLSLRYNKALKTPAFRLYRRLLIIVAFYMILHFLLLLNLDDRFFVAEYAIVLMIITHSILKNTFSTLGPELF